MKKKRKKMSPKRKELKAKDDEFSLLIRKRDGKCVKCGSKKTNQCAHIFSKKGSPHLRHYADNAITLCYACHIWFCHHQPVEFTIWVMDYIGNSKFSALYFKANTKDVLK